MKKTDLWRDEAAGRFYLIPSGVRPSAGPVLLRSGAARTISVRRAAVAPYEVSRAEARAFLDAQVEAWAEETKGKVEAALARFGIAGPASPETAREEPAAPEEDAAPTEPGPGVRLFAALTGESEQAAAGDPEAFLRGVGTLLQGAAELLDRAAQGPEGEAEARERLRKLGDTLREHGIAVPTERSD